MIEISAADLRTLLHELEATAEHRVVQPKVHIFDVRNRSETTSSAVIRHARNIPVGQLQPARHFPQDKDAVLIFTCAKGLRGHKAAAMADEHGYSKVYNLVGGMEAWIAAGLPTTKATTYPQPSVECFFDAATFTCQYVVTDDETRETVIIDPVLNYDLEKARVSFEAIGVLVDFVKKHNLKVRKIIETHVHADHLTGSHFLAAELQKLDHEGSFLPPICIGEGIKTVQAHFGRFFGYQDIIDNHGAYFDHLFKNNEEWTLGSLPCRALHTPGHTPDSISLLIGNAVFTGDSIFMPDFGSARCDFPNGSAKELYASVTQHLFNLPEDVVTFVGHDYMPGGRPLAFQASVAHQKGHNIHLKAPTSADEFVQLRESRDKTLGNPRLLFPSLQINLRAGRLPPAESGTGNVFIKIPLTLASSFK